MKLLLRSVLALGVSGLFSAAALADHEPGHARVELTQGLLAYHSDTTKVKPDEGDDYNEKDVGTSTLPLDLELGVYWNSLAVRVNPLLYQDGVTNVGVGYFLMDKFELGLRLRVINTKTETDPKTDRDVDDITSQAFIIYGTYGLDVGGMTIEFSPRVGTSTEKEKTEYSYSDDDGSNTTTNKTTETTTLTGFGLGVNLIVPVTENFSYVAGVGYGLLSGKKEKKDEDDGSAATKTKSKVSVNQLSVTVAAIRVSI